MLLTQLLGLRSAGKWHGQLPAHWGGEVAKLTCFAGLAACCPIAQLYRHITWLFACKDHSDARQHFVQQPNGLARRSQAGTRTQPSLPQADSAHATHQNAHAWPSHLPSELRATEEIRSALEFKTVTSDLHSAAETALLVRWSRPRPIYLE